MISNGDTIVVVGTEVNQELTARIHVTNNASSTKTVTVKKAGLSIVPGSANAFAFGQIEYSPGTQVSIGIDIAAASKDSFASFYFPSGFSGTSFIKYTFFDDDNPADSAWAIVEYNAQEISGVSATDASPLAVFPNPVHSIISISLPESADAAVHVRIFNSTGTIVYADFPKHDPLSIDVSGFPPGYYTIEAGGVTWKMIKQ